MKKSILFAGLDEVLWEEIISYSAQPASDWAPSFCRNGGEALRLSQKQQFAAIVTDFKLPDMGGLDLLDKLMERQAKAVRIVLSRSAEARDTVECIGRAHHHLFKPCTVEMLKNAMSRAHGEQWTPSEAVKTAIIGMRHAPSPPMIYFQVVSEMQSANPSVQKVSELVSQDPAMMAKILQLANSAVFGLQLEVIEPVEAISYIGLQTTKALVLMSHTFSTFHELKLSGFSVDALWAHCVLAGAFARRVAEAETNDERIIEEAFAAGLLHDFGKLLIGANLPDRFAQIVEHAAKEHTDFGQVEQKIFAGFGHAEIGACMLGIWWLPQPIVRAVAYHHRPAQSGSTKFDTVTAVHVADALAHEAQPDRFGIAPGKVDADYVKALGLENRWPEWREICLTPVQKRAA